MAETSLANLVVELTARSDKFEAAIKQVEGRLGSFEREVITRTSKIEAGFNRLSGFTSKIQSGLALIGSAAALGGLTALTKGALESAAAINDTATRLGISAEALQEWQFAAAQSGSSAEDFAAGLQILERNLAQAAAGTGTAKEAIKALGLDAAALAKDPVHALDLIADKIAAIPNQAQRAQVVFALLGKGAASLIPVLQQGSTALADLRQQAHETGNVMSEDLVKTGGELNDKFTAAADAIDKQFKSALISLAPIITKAVADLAPLATQAANILATVLQANNLGRQGRKREIAEELAKLQAEFVRVQQEQAGSIVPGFGARGGEISQQMQVLSDEFERLDKETAQLGTTTAKTSSEIDPTLAAALGKAGTAADHAAKALATARTEIAQQDAIYQRVIAGTLTLDEATQELTIAQLAERLGSRQLAEAHVVLKDKAEDLAKADALIAKQATELTEIRLKEARTAETAAHAADQRIDASRAEAAIIAEGIATGRQYDDIQRDIAITLKERELQEQGVTDRLHERAIAEVEAIHAANVQREALDKLRGAKQEALRDALLTTNDLKDVGADFLDDLFKGKLSTRAFKQKGEEIGKELIHGIFFGKSDEEHLIIGNFNDLVGIDKDGGIIGNIFRQGGTKSGQNFVSGFLTETGASGGSGGTGGLFGSGGFLGIGSPAGGVGPGGMGPPAPGTGIFAGQVPGAGFFSQGSGLFGGSAFGAVGGISGIGAGLFGSGDSGSRVASGVLGAAALIPGPQQPFVAAGAIVASLFASGFFDHLFGRPGRIAKEKKSIEKALEEIFDFDVPLKNIDKFRKQAEVNFDAVEGSLSSLGVGFALGLDLGGIGSVKRFGNLSQASFEQAGLSAKEAQAEVLDLAQALHFDLAQSIHDVNDALGGGFADKKNQLSLKEYMEEVREGQTDILTLNELLTGSLEIFTGFSPVINEAALANRFLSEEFIETATATGLMDARVQALALEVKAGMIPIEDAIIQLNAWRKAAGLTALELKDFHLDANAISEEAALIVGVATDTGRAAGDALSRGFEQGLSTVDFEAAFKEVEKGIIREAIIAQFVKDNIEQIFSGIDLTDPFSLTNDQIDLMSRKLGVGYENLRKILSAAGLLPNALEKAADAVGNIADEFRTVGKSIQQIIDSLLFGPDSPLAPTEQLGLLKAREQALRASLATAAPDKVPGILSELGDVIGKQSPLAADVFGSSSTRFLDEFNAGINTLEAIQTQATDAAASIDTQVLDSSIRQEDLLVQIRDTIAQGLGVQVKAATGGAWLATTPTRMNLLFGEAGPEYLQATPLWQMGRARTPASASALTKTQQSVRSTIQLTMGPGAVVINGGDRHAGREAADAFVEQLWRALDSDPRARAKVREIRAN